MHQNQILLLTSKFEGFPSVLVEGLISGLNIISYDCPNGPKEILSSGKFGTLLENEDCTPKGIVRSVYNLLSSRFSPPVDYTLLNLFSREMILDKYTEILK